jgi:hypothetical protein
MADPASRKDERWALARRRVRDPAAVELDELDGLLHHPVMMMAGSGHVKKMARGGEAQAGS